MTSAPSLDTEVFRQYLQVASDWWHDTAGFELAAAAPPPVLLLVALGVAALGALVAVRMWVLLARRVVSGCCLSLHHVHEVRVTLVAETSATTAVNADQWAALTKAIVGCSRAQSVYDPGTPTGTGSGAGLPGGPPVGTV